MKIFIEKKELIKPLQLISNQSIGIKQKIPILENILLQTKEDFLLLTGTNLEMEITVKVKLISIEIPGSVTISSKKFFNICRNLPETAKISLNLKNNQILIQSENTKYFLSTLPVSEFPTLDSWKKKIKCTISKNTLKKLIESTKFSMAYQDIRYYLNGMLFENEKTKLRTVSTDGHRLSICQIQNEKILPSFSVIIPRKSAIELLKILNTKNDLVDIYIGDKNIRIKSGNCIFTSRLIIGHFPNYNRILIKNPDYIFKINRNTLKETINRVISFSNERIRNVFLLIEKNKLKIFSKNLEREQSEETLYIDQQSKNIEVGFNSNYLLDVINTLKCEVIQFLFTNDASGVQIENSIDQSMIYIIMPIRL